MLKTPKNTKLDEAKPVMATNTESDRVEYRKEDRRDIQERKLSIWEIYRTLAAFSMASQWPRWGY